MIETICLIQLNNLRSDHLILLIMPIEHLNTDKG
jgi:hypothetical protein